MLYTVFMSEKQENCPLLSKQKEYYTSLDRLVLAVKSNNQQEIEMALKNTFSVSSWEIPSSFDDQERIVPEDSGLYKADLTAILARFDQGWGKYLSIQSGWYPLIADLNKQLAELFPGYTIQQIKEKFAGLRYYWEPGKDLYQLASPRPSLQEAESSESPSYQQKVKFWDKVYQGWLNSEAGQLYTNEWNKRIEKANQLVRAAESKSSVTCEICGAEGSQVSSGYWIKTLCNKDAQENGYSLTDD
jgi:hypothetical protein